MSMISEHRLSLVLFVLATAGCSHLVVDDAGGGKRALTATSPSGGYSGSHEEAIEAAGSYCRKSRQAVVIDHFEDAPEVGSRGEHTSRIVFTCAPPMVLHF
jgi:hypothetical protein